MSIPVTNQVPPRPTPPDLSPNLTDDSPLARYLRLIDRHLRPAIQPAGEGRAGFTSASRMNRAATPPSEAQLMVAGENSLVPIIYGRQRTGGKIAAIGFNGSNLVVAVVWCMGEVNNVYNPNAPEITINDAQPPAGSLAYQVHYTGAATQRTLTDANTTNGVNNKLAAVFGAGFTDRFCSPDGHSPEWALAYSVFEVVPGFFSGFPRFAAIIQGLKIKSVPDAYMLLNGSSQYLSTPDADANRINEDFEIVAFVQFADWTPASEQVIAAKWNTSGNQRAYRFSLQPSGALRLEISVDGINTKAYTSSSGLSVLGAWQSAYVRVRYDLAWDSDGDGDNDFSVASFAYGVDGQTWSALGADQTGTVSAGIHPSTAQLRIGADSSGSYHNGALRAAHIRSTARTACDFQIYDLEPNATSFTDRSGIPGPNFPQGSVWTCQAGAAPAAFRMYTQRPIDHLCDFATNKVYGAGRRIDYGTALHTYSLNDLTVGTVGSDDQHFARSNLLLANQLDTEAWIDVLRDYAYCFPILEGETYYFQRNWNDAAVAAFDSSNIIQGTFQIRTRSPENKPTVVEVAWTDTRVFPWQESVHAEYATGVLAGTAERRVSRVNRPGTTRFSEAKRYAIMRLNDAYYNMTIITFTVTDAALTNVRPGDIVYVSYPYESGNSGNTIGGIAGGLTYRVMRMDAAGPGRWQITASQHETDAYSTDATPVPPRGVTTLPRADQPPAVTSLTATESLYQLADSTWSSQVRLTWSHSTFPFVQHYWVEVFDGPFDDATALAHSGISYTPYYITPPLRERRPYNIRVRIYSTVAVLGAAGITTFMPQGKYLPPTWPLGAAIVSGEADSGTTTTMVDSARNEGTTDYWAGKWIKFTEGALQHRVYLITGFNYTTDTITFSPAAPSAPTSGMDYTIYEPGAALQGFEVGGNVLLSWPRANDLDTLRYEIRIKKTSESPTWATAAPALTIVDSLTYTIEGLSAATYRVFIDALDTVGNYTGIPLTRDVEVTTDSGNFQTLTLRPSSWTTLAVTQWKGNDGKTYAATDWGDAIGYGHGTVDNAHANGDFDDNNVPGTTVMTQPHSQAARFNLTNWVSVPYAAGLAVVNTFTVDLWFYINGTNSQNSPHIYSHRGNADPAGSWDIKCSLVSDLNYFAVTVFGSPSVNVILTAAGVFQKYRWHHLAVVNNAGSWKIYIDGEEPAGTSYAIANASNNSTDITIGHYRPDGTGLSSWAFNGLLSRVRLWSAALTNAEVRRCVEYRGTDITDAVTLGGNLTAANLKASWLLDDASEGSSNTVCDDGKNVSNGTFNNPIWRSWDEAVSNAVDFGQVYSGLFELVSGPTALNGNTRVTMMLSTDGTTYNEYTGTSTQAAGRFAKVKMQAEGGSALYNLSDAAVAISLSPKEETGNNTTVAPTVLAGPTYIPRPRVIALAGDYAQAISIQLTPQVVAGALPQGVSMMYDQVEVSFGRGMPTGRALRFSGGSGAGGYNWVDMGDDDRWSFTNGSVDSAFSVECWVKFNAVNFVQTFVAKGTGGITGEWQLRVLADSRIAILFNDDTAGAWRGFASQIPFAAGVWYHVCATYSGGASGPTTSNVHIYVNGNDEPITQYNGSGSYVCMRNTSHQLTIGNQWNNGNWNSPLDGVIDEVRIWNDVRTQQEVRDCMSLAITASTTPAWSDASLVGYWKFDEESGYTAADSQTSLAAKNGTLGTGSSGRFNDEATSNSWPTEKWWRPMDGFDVYAMNGTSGVGDVTFQYLFRGM